MGLHREGRPIDEVVDDLRAKREHDARWSDGRTFGMVYDGGPGVHEVAERAAAMYLHENALNTQAFPSLGEIQREVVGWVSSLLHGDDLDGGGAAGFLTSGGTESILCAVLAARRRAFAERGLESPSIVVAASAHAAFHKAADEFGLEMRSAQVSDDFTADVDAMADLVDDSTALVVASAPQYPQGVQDDVPAIAELATSVGASCHVDACMGGFVLPFAEMLGRTVEPWDFRVPGVTTISADVHKLGYAPKGVSVILHRDKSLRRHQTFVFDDWLGGMYATPNLQGTRSGLPMACAWAVMSHLGVDGYVELTRTTLDDADRLRAGVRGIDGLRVLGDPTFHLLAIAAEEGSDLDVFAVGDALGERGWHVDRQMRPDNLHLTVSNSNAGVVAEFVSDLGDCVASVTGRQVDDRSTTYATLE